MTSNSPATATTQRTNGRRAGVSQLAAVAAIAAADEHGQIARALRSKPAQPRPFNTVDDLKRANAAAGHHFFDADTLRFFSSRISDSVYGHGVFVTSERNEWAGTPRLYSVRLSLPTGEVVTLGEFEDYVSSRAAHEAATRLGKVWAPIALAYWAPYVNKDKEQDEQRRARFAARETAIRATSA